MAFTCAPWAKLNQIIVALHKRNHTQEQGIALSFGEVLWLNAYGAEQKTFPFRCGKSLAGFGQGVKNVSF